MNSDEAMNLVRQVLTLVGGLAVMHGIMTTSQESQLVSDLTVLVPAAVSLSSVMWSVAAHWRKVKVPENMIITKPGTNKTMTAHEALKARIL